LVCGAVTLMVGSVTLSAAATGAALGSDLGNVWA
jgi:hypothetical protein